MKSMQSNQSRKRPVNLTLNEERVSQAKEMTNNLSGVVEQVLTDFRDEAKQRTPGKGPHR